MDLNTTHKVIVSLQDEFRLSRAALHALRRMHKLRKLSIQGIPSQFAQLLHGVSFKLKNFTCTDPLDQRMYRFLDKQREIWELSVLHPVGPSSPEDVPNSILPNLRVLHSITPDLAAALIPQRPISHLEIHCWNDKEVKDFIPQLRAARSLKSLLIAQGFKVTAKDLSVIAAHLPLLSYLGECWLSDSVRPSCLYRLLVFTNLLLARRLYTPIVAYEKPSDIGCKP